ncbi:MAG: glycosyl hydrolase family 65 protein, partial [Eubacteriales bacterium]|nr:glycosyl hydrolase family 65 protein [Eubacteriales bacterium]
GYLGVRNAPEEGAAEGVDSIRGAYLNAFYEIKDVRYGEKLYGFPETQQVMVNVPDVQTVRLTAENEAFSMFSPEVTEREQTLDMQAGCTLRRCLWRSAKGDLRVEVRRMASFRQKGLFLLRYRVTSVGFRGEVRLTAVLNADVRNHAAANDPRVAAEPLRCLGVRRVGIDHGEAFVEANTLRSGLSLCCRVAYECPWKATQLHTDTAVETLLIGALDVGESVELNVYACYADSRRESEPAEAAKAELNACLKLGADRLMEEQQAYLNHFWRDARVEIQGDRRIQEAMDYDLYELLQSTGTDGVSNVAAKGLSGEGYEGHTFWDSEIYVTPFFLFTNPEAAKQMLSYRCAILPRARANARSLGFAKGALYPWRTIDGDECSAYFPAGTAQYHINGDIAYAFLQYWDATGDLRFMAEHGAEVVVETARFWLELGHMAEDGFRIECVTGPDEYTCLVNNNFYTNATAQYNLRGAVRLMRALGEASMGETVLAATGVTSAELEAFASAAERMLLPRDEKLGISAQDDSFLQKAVLDLNSIPKENFPLLLHYHPLFLYRYQVCKQADTVLAHLLFPDTADAETVRRSYEYYRNVTTHDSSLSLCVFAIAAARLGMAETAMTLYSDTVDLDGSDTHGNTRDGIHTANMGGAYLCVLRGFAGLTLNERGLSLSPMLPPGLTGYAFTLHYLGTVFRCEVNGKGTKLTYISGETVTVTLNGESVRLAPEGQEAL